ncbi:MAG: LamG domain-containing protein, partial [Planctomycetota bacterium]
MNLHRTVRATGSTACLLMLAAAAAADVYSTSANTNIRDNPPADVTEGIVENSSDVMIFLESTRLLASDLSVDHIDTGLVDSAGDAVPGIVPASTHVASWLVHFDPNDNDDEIVTAVIEFNTEILGICYTSACLNATDATLGSPTTTYPSESGRQTEVENDDAFDIASDRLSVTVNLSAGNLVDQMRIITAPSPRVIHEYNFEGNGIDCAGGADASPGSNVGFRRPDQGVPFAEGMAYRMGNSSGGGGVYSVPNADFTQFGLSDFSISFSLRRLQTDTGDVDYVLDGRETGDGWDLRLATGSILRFRGRSGGVATDFDSPSVGFGSSDNEWHHITFVCDRSEMDGARWYFDGKRISSADATVMGAVVTASDVFIGGQVQGTGTESLDGQMGRLRVWNYALTDDQVWAIGGSFFRMNNPCFGDL